MRSTRSRSAFVLSYLALAIFASARAADTQMPDSTTFAIRGVRVFDGDHVLAKANVVVREGHIVAVGPSVKIPAGITAIDGGGKTLLPGLIDAHVHSWGESRRDALRFGVTTELDMFSDWRRLADAKKQRESLDQTDSADLWSSGTLATVKGGHGTEYGMQIPVLGSADDAQSFVDARVKEGSDYIKIILDDGSVYGPTVHIPTLTPDEVKALIASAHKDHKMAVIHIAKESDARLAIEDGVDGLAHVFSDIPADTSFIKLAKQSHTFVVATLAVNASISGAGEGQRLRDDPRLKPFLSAGQYQSLGTDFPHPHPSFITNASESVRRLHVAGIPILAGTDAGNPGTAHGASVHEELQLLTKAGLTPADALMAATSLPAKYFHLADRGHIAPGMRADLVLVDGDPTTDITATRSIRQIWKNGYVVARALKPEQRPDLGAGAKVADDPRVSDFDGTSITSRYGLGWTLTTDQVAGGQSIAADKLIAGGAQDTVGALDVSGEIKEGFAYPWAGVMFSPGSTAMAPMDFSSKKEIVFWAKGDGRSYSIMMFSGANPQSMPLMQTFVAGPTWTEIHIALAGFSGVDPARVRGIAFCAVKPIGKFDFQIDQVEIR